MRAPRSGRLVQGVVALMIALVSAGSLVACGSAPSTPSPTASASLEPAATATPDIDPALVAAAGEVCQKAARLPLDPHPNRLNATEPTLTLIRDATNPGSHWTWAGAVFEIPNPEAVTAEQVQSVICIDERLIEEGLYTGSGGVQKAYSRTWNVLLVSWPDGQVMNATSFTNAPPTTIREGELPIGGRPVKELSTWSREPPNGRSLIRWQYRFAAAVQQVVLSPSGAALAIGLEDGTIHLMEVATAQEGRTFRRAEPLGSRLAQRTWGAFAFSTDGEALLSRTGPDQVVEWDIRTGEARQVYQMPFKDTDTTGGPPTIHLLDGGIQALTTTDQGLIQLWDVRTGAKAGEVAVWGDTETATPINVAWSPVTQSVAVLERETEAVRLWDLTSGQVIRTFEPAPLPVHFLYFSRDGSRLVGLTGGPLSLVWDPASGKLSATVGEQDVPANQSRITDDGRLLVLCDAATNRLQAWDTQAGRKLLETRSRVCFWNTWTETTTLMVAGDDGKLEFWDTETAQMRRRVPASVSGFAGPTDGMYFFPDGMTVASWDSFGVFEVRDIWAGQ